MGRLFFSARPLDDSVVFGKDVLRSKYFSPLKGDKDELFFLVSQEGVRAPELARLDLKTKILLLRRESFLEGKVIKVGGSYFTQGGNYTNPFRIYQGLFDKNAILLHGTESKMIQGFLKDGTPVYFDVPTSFDHPRLFVGKTFFADVHSSVFIDGDNNLYYFFQNGKTRTLYKNKTPLYS